MIFCYMATSHYDGSLCSSTLSDVAAMVARMIFLLSRSSAPPPPSHRKCRAEYHEIYEKEISLWISSPYSISVSNFKRYQETHFQCWCRSFAETLEAYITFRSVNCMSQLSSLEKPNSKGKMILCNFPKLTTLFCIVLISSLSSLLTIIPNSNM